MGLKLQRISEEPIISLEYLKGHYLFKECSYSYENLLELLSVVIDNFEEKSGLSLRKKIWKLSHNNCFINLINGPIVEIISIVDSFKNTVEPLNITRSNENILLKFNENIGMIHVTYEAGYSQNNLPECIKNSILEELWKMCDLDIKNSKHLFEFDYLHTNNFYFKGVI